jgi:hypothetical protein
MTKKVRHGLRRQNSGRKYVNALLVDKPKAEHTDASGMITRSGRSVHIPKHFVQNSDSPQEKSPNVPRGKEKARSINKNASKHARNKASTPAAAVEYAQPNLVVIGDPVDNDHQPHEMLHGQGHQGSLDDILSADYGSGGDDGETTPTESFSEDEHESRPQGKFPQPLAPNPIFKMQIDPWKQTLTMPNGASLKSLFAKVGVTHPSP